MTYKNIAPKILANFLMHGLTPREIYNFYEENRKPLIQAGVKVQNIPKYTNDQITIIVTKFSDRAYLLLENFLRKHFLRIELIKVEQLISKLTEAKEQNKWLDEKEDKEYFRSALYYIFNEDTPAEFLSFLHSQLTEDTPSPTENHASSLSQDIKPKDIPTLVSAAFGQYDENNREGLPKNIHDFFTALSQLQKGSKIDDLKISLESFPILSKSLSKAETAKKLELPVEAKGKGLSLLKNITSPTIDSFLMPDLEILAHCVTELHDKRTHFLDPIAIIQGNNCVQLTKELWEELLPTTGHLISYSDTPGLRPPRKNEYGIWKIEDHHTEQSIRCRLRILTRQVFEVHIINSPSDKYDSVRTAIKEFKPTIPNRNLFLLSDGTIIRLKHETTDYSRETFDEPLDAWNSLQAIKIGSLTLIVGPLPPADFTYDCSDLDHILKSLIKVQQELKVIPRVTKAQTSEIINALRNAGKVLDRSRVNQLNTELDRILETDTEVDKAMEGLLSHPKIIDRINSATEEAEQKILEQKNELLEEIKDLKTLKGSLDTNLKQKQSEQAKLPTKVKKEIRLAFKDAREKGMRSWADSAVIAALIEAFGGANHAEGNDTMTEQITQSLKFPMLSPEQIDLEKLLIQCDVSKQISQGIKLCVEIARNAGLGIIFSGASASFVARRCSKALSTKGVYSLNVPVGWINDKPIDICLKFAKQWDVLLLNNYNLSAIEAYGSQLLAILQDRIFEEADPREPLFIASVSDSVAALPRSHSFERLSISINLDQRSYPLDINFQLFKDHLDEAFRNTESRVPPWNCAMRKLTSILKGLKEDEQNLVIPIIMAGTLESPTMIKSDAE